MKNIYFLNSRYLVFFSVVFLRVFLGSEVDAQVKEVPIQINSIEETPLEEETNIIEDETIINEDTNNDNIFDKMNIKYRGFVRVRNYNNFRDNKYFPLNIRKQEIISTANINLNKNLKNISFIFDGELNYKHFDNEEDFLFNEIYSSYFYKNFHMSGGRKVVNWSYGYAWSPSDMINNRQDPLDPSERRKGTDILSAEYMFKNTSVNVILQLDSIKANKHIKLSQDIRAINTTIGSYFSEMSFPDESKTQYWGVMGKTHFNNNLDFYFETLSHKGRKAMLAREATLPTGNIYFFEKDSLKSNKNVMSYLIGLSYASLNSNFMFILEYYRNGSGYNKTEKNNFFDYASILSSKTELSDPEKIYAVQFNNINRQNYMRDYLFLSTTKTNSSRNIEYGLNAIWSINDNSFVIIPQFKYIFFNQLTIMARLTSFLGSNKSEFGAKPISNTAMVDVSYFF